MAETNTWDGVERMADHMKKRNLVNEEGGPVLANMVQAALAEPKKGFAMYSGGSVAEAMRRNMQADMATMQKFIVDNTLLDEIVKASFVKPQTLLAMLHRAMPCFDSMWVEWDEHARLQSRKKAHDKYTPDMYIQFNDDDIDLIYGNSGLLNCMNETTKHNSIQYYYKKETIDNFKNKKVDWDIEVI